MKVLWSSYEFEALPPAASWKDIPGIYIFSGLNHANKWVPLYIGQASSLSDRLSGHERWAEAARRGATHIHAMAVKLQRDRDIIEQQLIHTFQPPLNMQLK